MPIWGLAATYRLIHDLQPGAGGEQPSASPLSRRRLSDVRAGHARRKRCGGFNNKAGVAAKLPLETCLTINQSGATTHATPGSKPPSSSSTPCWGRGTGANLLLNVGPRHPDGTIGPEFTQRLQEVGKWLATYGESVYGTRRGPIPPQAWGISTAKGSPEHPWQDLLTCVQTQGRHIDRVRSEFFLDALPFWQAETARIEAERRKALVLDLPREASMPIDTIIALLPR